MRTSKTITVCILLIATLVLPPHAVASVASVINFPRAFFGVRIDRRVLCRTGDGATLSSDIYRPVLRGKTPTILVRIPYTKSPKNQFLTDIAGRIWSERGYTVVIQTTRGRGDSSGDYYPLIHEETDGKATLAWLKQQPWFNGTLYTWGGSAFGHTEWTMSESSDPHITGMFIYESSTDFHRMFYPGGAFALQSALTWAVNSNGPKDLPKWPEPPEIASAAAGGPVIDADNRATGHNIDFFDDWVTHREADAYWQSISGKNRASKFNGPVMMMAGWYDPFLPAQLADYAALKPNPQTRLVIGPWRHGGDFPFPQGGVHEPFRLTTITSAIDYFDRVGAAHLRRHSSLETPSASPVMLYVMGLNKWRPESEWPLKRTIYTPFYLSETTLAPNLPSHNTVRSYQYEPSSPVRSAGGAVIGPAPAIQDQSPIERRPDVLSFTTACLDHDLELTGPIKAILHVSTTSTSADFTAKLVDVTPSGKAYNISDGILRRHYNPNEPTAIELDLWPTSILLRKGHKLRVEISSSNFPHFDTNPNAGRQTLLSGPHHPSRLILPVIPTDAS